jgi:hypothetical protein
MVWSMVDKLRILETVDDQPVSAVLRRLLESAYLEFAKEPIDRSRLKRSLEDLLQFLASSEGRTHANCVATDSFFTFHIGEIPRSQDLPDDINGIAFDLGGALHDTFTAPHIAENFSSTPGQLLARVKALR